MDSRKLSLAAIVLAAPLLMAPSCQSEARILSQQKRVYCNEDAHVQAQVAFQGSDADSAKGALGLNFGSTTEVLQVVELHSGDSLVLSATIPWSKMANHRGEFVAVVADVGWMPNFITPGSTITNKTFYDALSSSRDSANLMARSSTAFRVCDSHGR